MRTELKFLALLGLIVIAGCSSGQSDSGEGEETPPEESADAGTDAVPSESTETPAAEGMAAVDPTAAPVTESGSSGQYEDYTVQKGDTLMRIAFEYYGDLYLWRKVYEGNADKIPDFNALVVGTVLKIERPSMPVTISRRGEKYLIKSGDTLGTISNEVYGTPKDWKKIWENNKQLIKDPNKIYAGFTLYYLTGNEPPEEVVQPQQMGQAAPVTDPAAGSTEPGAEAPPAEDTAAVEAPVATEGESAPLETTEEAVAEAPPAEEAAPVEEAPPAEEAAPVEDQAALQEAGDAWGETEEARDPAATQ